MEVQTESSVATGGLHHWIVPIIMLVLVSGVGIYAYGERSEKEPVDVDSPPPVVHIEREGMLYSYHVITGTEALFDLRTDPECRKNLVTVRREEALRLRRELETDLELDSLDQLRDEDDPQIRILRSLGYL